MAAGKSWVSVSWRTGSWASSCALAVSGERRYRWGALAGDVLAIVLGFLTFTREPGETGNVSVD